MRLSLYRWFWNWPGPAGLTVPFKCIKAEGKCLVHQGFWHLPVAQSTAQGGDWRLTCESPHEHPLTAATWHQLTGVWVNLEINSAERGVHTGWKLIWPLTSVIFNYLNCSWQATMDLYTCRNAERLTITHHYHSCRLRRNISPIAMTGNWLTSWWILVQKQMSITPVCSSVSDVTLRVAVSVAFFQ